MKMKGKTQVTDIGLIPMDWDVMDIASVTHRVTKGTTPTTLKKPFVKEGINFVKVESITEYGEFIKEKFAHIDEETNKLLNRSIMEEDDVLFSIAGVIGRTAIVNKEILPANTNQAIAILRPIKEEILPKFLRYAVSNKNFILMAQSNIVQTAQPNLSLGILSNSRIAVPSYPEQKAITKTLSDIDKKNLLLKKQNEHLEKMGLIMFKNYISENGNNSEWEESSLDGIAQYLNGLVLQKFPPKGEGDLPVIKIKELKQGITESSDKSNSELPPEYIIEDGDILFSWSGSLEVVIWGNGKGALNQHLFKVTSKKYPKWFYYYWTLHHLRQFKGIAADKATTMGHIKRRHLTEAKVFIPPKEELDRLDKLFEPIINKQILLKVESRNLTKTRDLLLPKLMSGKIRVPVEVQK